MDVTFREEEPYYTNKCDLDPFLEEFSSVTESDSREGGNEYGENGDVQNDGVTHEKVVVGTIPCPINEYGGSGDLASEASEGVIVGGAEDVEALGGVSGDHDGPSIDGQEGMEDGEAVVGGGNPMPH